MLNYLKRVADEELKDRLDAFGAVLITGPKGCGKTTTALQKAVSVVEFQDEDKRNNYLLIANTKPSLLLEGPKPRLFDEWQDAPKIWGVIRKSVDDEQKNGLYILTGSTSQTVGTPHTGTLRISTMKMLPMSLFESKESNGNISLLDLFDGKKVLKGCKSDLSLEDLIHAICRGGWPHAVDNTTERSQLAVAKDLFWQTCHVDASNIDHKKRRPLWVEAILRSYARNICTFAKSKTIYEDACSGNEIGEVSFYDYVHALEELFIIEDIRAWSPAIRSKTTVRALKKRNLIDPSIAVAALGLSPAYFKEDFKTLGFLFESLCMRDLKVYSSALGGELSYYHDRYGLEADAVLHLADGRYALIEFKLGAGDVDEGAAHLLKIENLLKEYNEKEKQVPLRLPDLKLVITAAEFGYQRDDGVYVVPIGCLKP